MFRFYILCAALVFLAPQSWGQENKKSNVSAYYEVTSQIERKLPPAYAHLASQLPTSNTTGLFLRYDGNQALSDTGPAADSDDRTATSDGMHVRTTGAKRSVYVDVDGGAVTKQVHFMDRQFLISSDAPEIEWRLTQEVAEFLGYPAFKATATVDGKSVEAWFTPDIAAPVGPDTYGGLPGLILVLTEDGGRRTFVAQEVSTAPLEEAIQPPTEGRRMTSEEYRSLVQEKMEQIRSDRQAGTVIIPGN